MGTRSEYAPGTFSWVDLTTSDGAGAKDFYGGLLGWEFEDNEIPGGGAYTICKVDGDRVAAIPPATDQFPPHWNNYVTVASADDSAAKAKELGASLIEEPFDVMDAGRMALLQDPTGAALCIWEPREAIGAGRVNDHGCLTWNELSTNDTAAAEEFYSALFGWRFDEIATGGPSYWTIGHDGAAAGRNGGMRELAPQQAGVPPHWMPYFAVTSADQAAERAQGAGGSLLYGPIDIPTTDNRIAVLHDPQGAVFAVFQGEVDD